MKHIGLGFTRSTLIGSMLYACKYAESTMSEDMCFQGGDATKRRTISFLFFLIRLPGKLVLCDVGCDDMPGWEMRHFIKPVELLQREGIAPENITDILITHHHHDHLGAVAHFPQATVYIQEEEAKLGQNYLAGRPGKIVTFQESVSPFDGIEMQRIGGHSPGSSIIHIPLQGRTVTLAGDECYVRDCITKRIPTGAACSIERCYQFLDQCAANPDDVLLFHENIYLPGTNGITQIG